MDFKLISDIRVYIVLIQDLDSGNRTKDSPMFRRAELNLYVSFATRGITHH